MENYPEYNSKLKWIHWLTFILVFLEFILLIFKVTMSQYLGGMFMVYLFHKSFGVVIFMLTILRFIVIKEDGVPEVLPKKQKLQRILSKSTQGFIYILLIMIPLSGYLMSSRSLNFFGIISIPAIDMSNAMYQLFHILHKVSSYLLIVLLILHIVSALYHYFWIKDKVLQSMLKVN
ncbi:cytochrome b [Gilliamella sp. B2776]|uniref:cytochrome b n=1 Tax=unclassified Gilliamella TaxID=2685620 RepID=UPI00226A11E6|nr:MULTISPECIES: cytochrome b/b6 domain-containing protein [unclassified Gilliamella]MCX8649678.1 cytochrome b [Gilliamella sp. B2779]MCX8654804.1 cytochrome b [Gilliamella sp. B2737]MCX8656982.1 cytochrome b [Gilliamella sp. B2894]MCX8665064.1 cytochrome b [Gilliamella sp. B2887]MCX8691332.1 cytochrome b [Gilliamella sp. B2776]